MIPVLVPVHAAATLYVADHQPGLAGEVPTGPEGLGGYDSRPGTETKLVAVFGSSSNLLAQNV